MTTDAILKSALLAFKKMISSSSDISSKRVVGFEMAQLFVVMVIWHLITGKTVQEVLVYTVASLIVGLFGLNAVIDIAESKKTVSNPPDGTEVK